jgi:hypothetical protein
MPPVVTAGFGGNLSFGGISSSLRQDTNNLRSWIVSPQGYSATNSLKQWGASLKFASTVATYSGSAIVVGGAVTLQPEVVAFGAMGVAVGDALDIGADALLGTAAFMQSVQENSSAPLVQFSIQGAIDQNGPSLPIK